MGKQIVEVKNLKSNKTQKKSKTQKPHKIKQKNVKIIGKTIKKLQKEQKKATIIKNTKSISPNLAGKKNEAKPIKKSSKFLKSKKKGRKSKISSPKSIIQSIVPSYFPYQITTIPSYFKKQANSCGKIASTRLQNSQLGYQISKKSIKEYPQGKARKVQTKSLKKGEKSITGMIDIVFCCDTTGFMINYLSKCKKKIKEIMKDITNHTSQQNISVKFGFVAYRNHFRSYYLTNSYDLADEEEIILFMRSLDSWGGGENSSAVMDGLYESAKHMSWRDNTEIPSLRYIFHFTYIPPNGKQYGGNKIACTCQLDIDKISQIINLQQIHYRLINVTDTTYLQKMFKIFKRKIDNIEYCTIDSVSEMDIRINEMITNKLDEDDGEP